MTRKRISVAGAKEPTGWWFKVARYFMTIFVFLNASFFTMITQRTVVFNRHNARAKGRRIYVVTHRTLWDSFWFGVIFGWLNLVVVFFRQKLIPVNMPDGLNFMDSPTTWLFMRLMRCFPVHRKGTIKRLGRTDLDLNDVQADKFDTNSQTWNGIKENLKNGGTLLWFLTSGRDVILDEENKVILDSTVVSRPILALGKLLLELEAEGESVEVVPVYTVNDSQRYRKTRDDVPGPWHLVPSWLGIRKFLKIVVWILAQKPFRYRHHECLVANFGDPIPSAELVAAAGDGNSGRRAQNVADKVADAIRALKPRVMKFRQQPGPIESFIFGRRSEAA